jgi:hypothetical protein
MPMQNPKKSWMGPTKSWKEKEKIKFTFFFKKMQSWNAQHNFNECWSIKEKIASFQKGNQYGY